MNTRRTLATAATVAVLAGSLAAPALAKSDRMALQCTEGTLVGHVIERSNGASWWDRADGTVFTTRYLRVSLGDEIVHEKTFGAKSGPIETCAADHFGFAWYVELAAAGAP